MNQLKRALPSLAEIEREVVAESREWGRQRLQERLQQLADQQGEVMMVLDERSDADAGFLRLLTDPTSTGAFVL